MWYVDTSAFVKLVRAELESAQMRQWIDSHASCSSDVLRTELRRAVSDEADARLVEELLAATQLLTITRETFDRAGLMRVAARLRSLDALHIAAAMQLGIDLEGIVTYDRRMTEAAASLGIAVAAPA